MKQCVGALLLLISLTTFGQNEMVVTNSFDTLVCNKVELERHSGEGIDFLVIEKLDGKTSRMAVTSVFNYTVKGEWKMDNQTPLPLDEQTGEIIYQEIQNVDGVSSEELFTRAKYWVANNYVSANDVIQFEDRKRGVLVAKGNITTGELSGFVRHTLEIACKEGRYRVEYKNLSFHWSHEGLNHEYSLSECFPASEKLKGNSLHRKFVVRATNRMDISIKESLKSLDGAMRKPIQSDW
ncbi:MAG: DUF4468 domain-containing protein [Flavobacteriales bacterium]|nr:DUF4468 domain-containing protein [Flavobacteriales bacterium]